MGHFRSACKNKVPEEAGEADMMADAGFGGHNTGYGSNDVADVADVADAINAVAAGGVW